MVGLRLRSGCVVKQGDPLYTEEDGVVPWAAALSDALLSSNCAACFAPCDPLSRCPCHGPCHGALAYCSLSCRDLDLPLHFRSRECNLLALLRSPASPVLAFPLPSRFPSLDGTCDLRAALRLLAYHHALNHIAPFLAASRNPLHDVPECPRLGGLLSNRSSLLQPTPLDHNDKSLEQEEDELLIATELREAAMLLHNVVYSPSSEPCVCYSPKHNQCMDHVSDSHTEGVHLRSCENADGHVNANADVSMVKSGHLSTHKSTIGNVHTHMDVCMGGSEHLDMQELTHAHLHRHMEVHMVKWGDLCMHEATDADTTARMAGADDEMWRETAHGHVIKNMGVHVTRSGYLGTHGTTHADTAARMARTDDKMRHKTTHGHVHTHIDVHMATHEHFVTCEITLEDTASRMARNHNKMPPIVSMTPAEEILLVEEVLCQVFTNAVRIQVDTWTRAGHLNVRLDDLGTAVYGPLLSWINHSCRPNAFYSFVLAGPAALKSTLKVPLAPDQDVTGLEDAWGLKSCCYPWLDDKGLKGYGPLACLRSMGNIKGLESVCISYTDLLLPKSKRRQELWLKYRFNCICERCDGKPTSNVDEILQNIGFWGSRRDTSTLEDWLHEESDRGLSEFLNNDDPLSCCKSLEDVLVRILWEAYQNLLDDGIPQTFPLCAARLESFNLCGVNAFFGHGSCSEASKRHGIHVKVHLMHHLCLDIYMALSSSYKILATGFNGLRLESTMFKDSVVVRCGLPNGLGEVEWSMASAAYTIVLAVTIQYLCDSGELGLLGIAARFWLQTGEAFVSLILKLDSYFCLDNTLEIHKLSRVCSDFKSKILFCDEKEFLWQLESSLNAHGRLLEAIRLCDSMNDLLRCLVTGLWPFLRSATQFLSYIETPFDINQVCFGSSGKQAGIMPSKDVWICCRIEAFICMLCSLRLGLKFMNICCGYNEKLNEALKNLVCSCFQKTETE